MPGDVIEFTVEGVGHFKVDSEPSVEQEFRVDARVDDTLGGRFFEMQAKAEELEESKDSKKLKIAEKIRAELATLRMAYILDELMIESPIGKVSGLKDKTLFSKILDGYLQKKVGPTPGEKGGSEKS